MKSALTIAFRFVIPPVLMIGFVAACWKLLGYALAACSHSYGTEAIEVRRSWLRRRLGLGGARLPRRNFAKDKSGTVAIEAALIFPIMIFGIALGVDAGLATVAKYQLVMGVSQAAIATASGSDAAAVFAANSSGSVTCTSDGSIVTCNGQTTYPAIFAGVLGVSSIPLSVTAAAAIQKVKS